MNTGYNKLYFEYKGPRLSTALSLVCQHLFSNFTESHSYHSLGRLFKVNLKLLVLMSTCCRRKPIWRVLKLFSFAYQAYDKCLKKHTSFVLHL